MPSGPPIKILARYVFSQGCVRQTLGERQGPYLQALTSEGELGIKQPMHNLTVSLGESMGCVLRAEEGFLERDCLC